MIKNNFIIFNHKAMSINNIFIQTIKLKSYLTLWQYLQVRINNFLNINLNKIIISYSQESSTTFCVCDAYHALLGNAALLPNMTDQQLHGQH